MTTPMPTRGPVFWKRRGLAPAAAILAGLVCAVPPAGVAAQASNSPIVQVICEVNGGVARTVRVTYPAMAVKNVHVFTPLSGGANVVIHPSGRTQVYSLAVPAGSYSLKYAPQLISGGYSPVLNAYGPVIVIPRFKVVGRMCERSRAVGTPSS